MRALLSILAMSALALTAFASPAAAQADAEAPAPADDCAVLYREIQEKIDAFVQRQREEWEAFVAQQERDLKEYSEGNHTANETSQFREQKHREWEAFKQKQQDALDSFLREVWESFKRRCPDYEHSEEGRSRGYGGEGPPECRAEFERARALMEELHRKWEARHRQFQEQFDAAREEFMKAEHSQEEWKAFAERWHQAAKALHEEQAREIRAAAEAQGMGDCASAIHGPVPAYAEAREPREYPKRAGGPDFEMDEEGRKIMERCEARMKQAMEEYYRSKHGGSYAGSSDYQSGAGMTYTMTSAYPTRATEEPARASSQPEPAYPGDPRDDPELRAKIEAIQAECEKEMREYMAKHGGPGGKFGSFHMSMDEQGRIIVKGRWVRLVGIPESQSMTEIQVREKLYVDRLYAKGYLAQFQPEETEEGTAIQVFDSQGEHVLSVHDHRQGIINAATSGEIPAVILDLADDLQLARNDHGVEFKADGKSRGAVLLHKGSIDIAAGNVLTIVGRATFLVDDDGAPEPVREAMKQKRIGAQVVVSADGKTDTAPIGDLEVKVKKEAGKKFVARVESADGKGKTVVFCAEPELFETIKLKVRVVGVEADGSETALEVRKASNLEDVLDPHDDGEAVEYWIAQDEDCVQILVSFPHFSEKKVTVEADTSSLLTGLPGFEAVLLLAGVGAALVGLGLRRRRA